MGKRVFQKSSEMYPLVEKFMSTGYTQKQFSKDQNISLHIFNYWVRKYKSDHEEEPEPRLQKEKEGKGFLKLDVKATPSVGIMPLKGSVEINYLNGTSLRISDGLNWELLERVMAKLSDDSIY